MKPTAHILNRFNRYPSDWRIDSFGDIAQSTSLGTPERGSGQKNVILVKMGCLRWGDICIDEAEEIDEQHTSSYPAAVLRDGDFMLNTRNTSELVGKSAVWHLDKKAMCDNNILVARMRDPVNSDFVCMQMCFGRSRARLKAIACGSTSVAAIYWKDLEQFPVFYPGRAEQDQIVSLINRWSKAIVLLDQKQSQRRMFLKGITQQLLIGKRRIRGYSSLWRTIHLGDLFHERSENGRTDLSLLSITGEGGVIPRCEDRKDTSSEDKSKYLRICPGDIGYNTMRMWQGVCGLSRHEGILSPAYTVITPGSMIDGEFAAFFFKFPPVVNLFRRYSQGLVDDTLNLKFHHFAQIKVVIPPIDEQRAIAQIIKKANAEISVLERLSDAYREQKNGLMQQLLTGKRRVKVQAA